MQSKKTPLKNKFIKTGEQEIFFEIYNERPPYCQKCGQSITMFNVSNYHHIKPKSRFPELRLDKNNIIKICFDCHFKIHNKGKK